MLGIVRLRRYRSLLLFSLIAMVVFFHFHSFSDTGSSFSVGDLTEFTATPLESVPQYEQQPMVPGEASIPPPVIPPIEKPSPRPEVPAKEDKLELKPEDPVETPKSKPAETSEQPPASIPTLTSDKLPHQLAQENRPIITGNDAVLTIEHWVKSPEHFPVPEEQIFPLPKKYKKLPQIQASFAKELGSKRKVRLQRQKAVKDAMIHTWKGYRQNAWLHDELLPVTRYFKDPFAGWGATLVDALDTLWIMGLEEEFLEAVEAVGKIDFTTTQLQKIPVFETVIRYLGGLIGAYDVSGGKHQVLLDKAIELGDMLYGVFDTPNRMPVLHWGWRPGQTAITLRGEFGAVSAELGSLTVEFTRLAQITGNNSYFDAVQRITDALEEFQPRTNLPGMWPLNIDTSGCKVVQVPLDPLPQRGSGQRTGDASDPIVHKHEKRQGTEQPIDWLGGAQGNHIMPEVDESKQQQKKPAFAAEAPVYSETEQPIDWLGAAQSKHIMPEVDESKQQQKKPAFAAEAPVYSETEQPIDWLGAAQSKHIMPEVDESKQQQKKPAITVETPVYSETEQPIDWLGAAQGKHIMPEVDESKQQQKKPAFAAPAHSEIEQSVDWLGAAQSGHIMPDEDEPKQQQKPTFTVEDPVHRGLTKEAQSGKIHKEGDGGKSDPIDRQLALAVTTTVAEFVRTSPSCVPRGLAGPNSSRDERFTLGGMADSLYEYLIKEYILLGGASDQYKKMYESSMEKAKKYLFFRPLAEGDPDVLLSGNVNVDKAGEITFDTDSGHLSCFTGGMLALGARALGHEADLEIGAKLTDGCVWAYASFESGIMPESFNTAYCKDSDNCKFSATEYYEQLVPKYRRPKNTGLQPHQHAKRVDIASPRYEVEEPGYEVEEPGYEVEEPENTMIDPIRVQKKFPTTLKEIAEQIIDEDALPTGFTKVTDKRYILRPEAIESVFIMYRVTADTTWQDKGWRMWQNVEKATRTPFAFSAINDVTRSTSDPKFVQLDEMESFWLAETLKYYYLLFSEPDLISLDDYVLNTEAHPLRRPRPSS